jgi:DNA polymerase III epsilon subunit-like protein
METKDTLYLIFDTETTGLFQTKDKPSEGKWKARHPMLFPEDYPRVFQLAWVLMNQDGEVLDSFSEFIKPDGWVIPTERDSPDVPNFWEEHGYSTEECERVGVPMKVALQRFADALERADYLVAHNIDYDRPVILAEIGRYEIKIKGPRTKLLCTMRASIDFVQAPHSPENIQKWAFLANKPKFPKLEELHLKLFDTNFSGAHNALEDVKATFKCLKELIRRDIMNLNNPHIPIPW